MEIRKSVAKLRCDREGCRRLSDIEVMEDNRVVLRLCEDCSTKLYELLIKRYMNNPVNENQVVESENETIEKIQLNSDNTAKITTIKKRKTKATTTSKTKLKAKTTNLKSKGGD